MATLKKNAIRFLRWSEKYTKTDMVFLVSRSGLGITGQGITTIAALAFAIVVGHVLPKETYGEYKYVLSIIALLSLFSLNSIGGAVFQSTAQGYGGTLTKGFWANIRWSFVVFIGALMLAGYYFFNNPQLAAEILIGGCLSPFVASANLYGSFLTGKKAFIRQMLYGTLDNVIIIGIMTAAVVLTHNALILVAVYFLSNFLAALFFYKRTKELYATSAAVEDASMLTYSKHLSFLGILGGIADTLDQILVFHFVGAAQLAIFVFATALPDQLRTPIKNLDTMVQARFVGRSSAEIERGMKNKFLWYFICSTFATILFIILAPYIFEWLFPAYIGSVFYAQIYMVGLISVTFDPANSYLSSRKKVKEIYIVSILSALIQIGGMFVGLIYWGVLGLVAGQTATRIISLLIAYVLYRGAIRRDIAHAQ